MIQDFAKDCDHCQTRLRLESKKRSALSGVMSTSAQWPYIFKNLLKNGGFYERGRQNCSDYRLERNDVYLADLPASFDGYTILHLSDLHADGLIDKGKGITRILETVQCDLGVLTGDYSFDEGVNYGASLEALAPIVSSISAQDGIYGVLGDHDLLEMVPALELMGVQMLINDAFRLHRGTASIMLAGVDDPHFYECHDLQKALSKVYSDQLVILLSHSPEIATEASMCGVDFYLCGHTHGGQICLPGGIPVFSNVSCNRSYLSGSWRCGPMQGYTSRGTGFSFAAARFFCPPEITLHTLHSGNLPSDFCGVVEERVGGMFNVAVNAVYA